MPDGSDLFLSLLQKIVQLDGRSLVLQVGELPVVVTATDRVALGSRILSEGVISALIEDVLSNEARTTLRASGWVQFALPTEPGMGREHFSVIAAGRERPSLLIQRSRPESETSATPEEADHVNAGAELPFDDHTLNVPPAPISGLSSGVAARSRRFPPLVLLIDDSLDQLDVYEVALSDRYEVLTASDGETGAMLATTRQPDVVLVDLSMPRVDGWEVCRRLKSNLQTAAIPIIILTAHDGADIERRAVQTGAVDLLHKPCSVDLLRDRIDAVTRSRST